MKALLFGKGKRLQDEFFVLLPMLFHPIMPCLLPGQLATVFTFDPFVFPDLFLDQVSDPVRWIRGPQRRNLNIWLGNKNLTHGRCYRMTFSAAESNKLTLSMFN